MNRRAHDTPDGDTAGRVPPHNVDAERALLGAAMLSSSALEVLATETRPEDFYVPSHAHVAAAMVRIFTDGATNGTLTSGPSPADPVVLGDALERDGLLEAIGGIRALATMQSETPATSSAARYARIVHDHATLRRTIYAAAEITELGYSLPLDVHDAVLRAQSLVADVAANNGSRTYSTLDFGDVTALLAGSLTPVEPDFLRRSDGQALIYAGRMHLFHGEPTAGKTWLALLCALEILRLGGAVLYLDYEDSLAGIVSRLLAMGADPDDLRDRFVYLRQDGPFGTTEKIELGARLKATNPDLVILDGVSEALSRDGLSEDRATEVVEWIEKLPRWLARTGAAVILLDHVAKDKETRGRWARGSSAKLAAIDGAAYEMTAVVPFSKHRAGKTLVKTAKDRHGTTEVGKHAAAMLVTPVANGERVVVELIPPEEATESTADAWKPTILMRRVSEELERAVTPLTAKSLGDLVHGDKKLIRTAISRLIAEGWVHRYRIGSAEYLRSLKPYGEHEDAPEPDPELPLEDDAPATETDSPGPPPDNVTRGPWKPGDPL